MSTVELGQRTKHVTTFLVMEILDRAQCMQREGIDVVHLEAGEPDFDTPQSIVDAGKAALDEKWTHYTASQGMVELRTAVAEHYLKRYNVTISPDQVLVFPGSSIGMKLLFDALIDPEDEVILANPCYACYATFVRQAGGTAKEVLTYEEEGFQYRPEDVKNAINAKTKAIFMNSPANPTGIVMEQERMQALASIADTGPLLISDEIYHGLAYEGEEHSILEFTKNAVVIGGFSKAYAMTGWRVGYLIVPPHFAQPLIAFMQRFLLSTNTVAQIAATHALREADADIVRMREVYNERRLYAISALRELGFNILVEPKGAFYLLFNAKHLAKKFDGSSVKLAFDILEKAHVGITPGVEFGSQAEGFLRISYATSMENIREGVRRLGAYIDAYHTDDAF